MIRDGLVFDACMFYNNYLGSAYGGFGAFASTGGVSWTASFDGFILKGMKNKLKNTIVSRLRAID